MKRVAITTFWIIANICIGASLGAFFAFGVTLAPILLALWGLFYLGAVLSIDALYNES